MFVESFLLAAASTLLADLRRFPGTQVCWDQHALYQRNERWLIVYRSAQGWSNGQWDACLAENARGIRYWTLLGDARGAFGGAGFGKVWRARRLQELRRQIGEERYQAGWHPPLYPECLEEVPGWSEEE